MSSKNSFNRQTLWGWKVALHLYLVGLAAGAYIAGSLLHILNPGIGYAQIAKIAVSAAIPILIISIVFILSHVGKIASSPRALLKPGSSWLSRGSIALLAFLVISIIQFLLWVWPSSVLSSAAGLNTALQTINSILAIYILIYSGMLLATLKSFPFWHTRSLPLMFTVSGLAGGLMLLVLLAPLIRTSTEIVVVMLSWIAILLVLLALVLVYFLARGSSNSWVRDSVRQMITANGIEFYFWVVIAGWLVPLAFSLFAVFTKQPLAGLLTISMIAMAFGLIGSYFLKNLILISGQSAGLQMPGETVSLPKTARVPASERVHYRWDG